MNTHHKRITTAIATLLATAVSSVALAAGGLISPTQAIDIAEKQAKGKAIHVDLERKSSGNYYDVEVWANGVQHELRINAQNGQIIKSDIDHDDDDHEHAAAAQAKISLQQAIRIAEKHTGGQTKEAEFDLEHSQAVYKVETVRQFNKQKVYIDAQTGAVIRVKNDD